MRKKLLDDVTFDDLLQYRAEGYSDTKIAEMLEVSQGTISKIFREHGHGKGRNGVQSREAPVKISKVPIEVKVVEPKLRCAEYEHEGYSFKLDFEIGEIELNEGPTDLANIDDFCKQAKALAEIARFAKEKVAAQQKAETATKHYSHYITKEKL